MHRQPLSTKRVFYQHDPNAKNTTFSLTFMRWVENSQTNRHHDDAHMIFLTESSSAVPVSAKALCFCTGSIAGSSLRVDDMPHWEWSTTNNQQRAALSYPKKEWNGSCYLNFSSVHPGIAKSPGPLSYLMFKQASQHKR